MSTENTITSTSIELPATEKRSFLKDVAKGLLHVVKVAWTVPAAHGFLATLLVRAGIPATLVSIGVAVGEKLVN